MKTKLFSFFAVIAANDPSVLVLCFEDLATQGGVARHVPLLARFLGGGARCDSAGAAVSEEAIAALARAVGALTTKAAMLDPLDAPKFDESWAHSQLVALNRTARHGGLRAELRRAPCRMTRTLTAALSETSNHDGDEQNKRESGEYNWCALTTYSVRVATSYVSTVVCTAGSGVALARSIAAPPPPGAALTGEDAVE